MKTYRSLFVCSLLICNLAFAQYVNIISQNNHVWGWASYPHNLDLIQNYDLSGSTPQSGMVQQGVNQAQSSAGNFTMSAYKNGEAGEAMAYAQIICLFTPVNTLFNLSITGSVNEWAFENKAKFSLLDTTSGITLADYNSPSMPIEGYTIDFNHDYTLDLSHQYQLSMYVMAQRGEGGDGSASLTADIIPEPATLLLILLGSQIVRRKC